MTNDQLDNLKELAERAMVEFWPISKTEVVAVSPDIVLELIKTIRIEKVNSIGLEGLNEHLKEENEALRAQLAEAQEVLEYYADANEWIDFKAFGWSHGTICQVNSHFDSEPWEKARKYLEKYPK